MNSIIISGTRSGVGKTTITTAILSLLDNPIPFKLGPDFIDPMFHKFVCGNDSTNLDLYMMEEDTVKFLFNKHSKNDGFSVLEGMMGLYDGLGNDLDNYSSAHISRVLKIPIILVVDGKSIGTSLAAVIRGYETLDSRVCIKGVIINRVSESMYLYHKKAIEKYTSAICVGYLPNDEEIVIKERHLGLMQASEVIDLKERINHLKTIASKTIDIKAIKKISKDFHHKELTNNELSNVKNIFKGIKVGIAKDKAFSFYYNDNIELMKYAGMEIEYFSPLNDKCLPEVDCLYIGGGYPEVYGDKLSNNKDMLNAIRKFSESNKLIYGECGGMMYLSKYIETVDEDKYEMCGIFKHNVKMQKKLNIKRFGYIIVNTLDNIKIKAHEFHYSDVFNTEESNYYYSIKKAKKERKWQGGFIIRNTIAGYPHIHFYSNIGFFVNLFNRI